MKSHIKGLENLYFEYPFIVFFLFMKDIFCLKRLTPYFFFTLPFQCNELISGERAPKEEEIKQFESHLTEDEKSKVSTSLEQSPIKEYWFKVLNESVRVSKLSD